MKKKVSVIITSWNTKELLKQCLKSLVQSAKFKVQSEIIVVDNGSTDGSPEMVKKEFPQAKLIQNKENLGFAKGNNLGLRQAQGEYIMLLNSDTIVRPGAIEKLVEYLEKHEEVAAVSPLLLNRDGTWQKDPAYLKLPSPLRVFLYYNPLLRKLSFKFFPGLLLSATDFNCPSLVDQLPGAAMVVRAGILKAAGGFNEGYPHFFEDSDLSFRLKKAGGQLVLVPESQIIHLGRQSLRPVIDKEGKDKFYFLNFNSLFLFCRQHYSPFKTALIKAIVLGQLLLSGKISLVKKLI